jgi:hypothetical protein
MQNISNPTENLDGTLGMAAGFVNSMSKRLKEVAVEMADMSFDEFERSAELLGDLVEARTLDRIVEIEADYLKCAHRALSDHALRLRDLYAAIGRDMTKPLAAAGTDLFGPA